MMDLDEYIKSIELSRRPWQLSDKPVEVEKKPKGFQVPIPKPEKPKGMVDDSYIDYVVYRRLTPRCIWTNEHDGTRFTTVKWMDGTKTTVKCAVDAPQVNDFSGFTAALSKKIYGSTTNTMFVMKEACEKAEEHAKRQARIRERDKKLKQERHQSRMKERERRIQAEMEDQRIQMEARRRLDAEMTEEGKNVERD